MGQKSRHLPSLIASSFSCISECAERWGAGGPQVSLSVTGRYAHLRNMELGPAIFLSFHQAFLNNPQFFYCVVKTLHSDELVKGTWNGVMEKGLDLRQHRVWSWLRWHMGSGFGEVTGCLRGCFFHGQVRGWRGSLGPHSSGVLRPAPM